MCNIHNMSNILHGSLTTHIFQSIGNVIYIELGDMSECFSGWSVRGTWESVMGNKPIYSEPFSPLPYCPDGNVPPKQLIIWIFS